MEILCPHCQQRLNIADELAGQFLKCSLCGGMFSLPAPPTPPAPPQQMPQMELTPTSNTPVPRPSLVQAVGDAGPDSTGLVQPRPAALEHPAAGPWDLAGRGSAATPPPGTYNRVFMINFNRDIITWLAPVSLALIFLLSFFSWFSMTNVTTKETGKRIEANVDGVNMWVAGFGTTVIPPTTKGFLGLYIIIFLLTVLSAIASQLLGLKLFALPEPFKKVRPWRSLIVAGLAAVGFLILFFIGLGAVFGSYDPTAVWFKLVILLQFLAFVGALLDYWLQRRKKMELPVPKIEFRW